MKNFNEPFQIEEIDIKPRRDEALVKVKASGICGRDLVIWKGGFKNLQLPLILGHEIFGEFNDAPIGIYGALTCGECKYCRSGKENLCTSLQFLGEGKAGGYAEAIAVPKNNIFPLPDREYEKYAATVCPLATAIHASKLADVKGKKVLVTGAGGGVGIHTIQYLKFLRAHVISITSESKVSIVKKYSDEVITEKEFSKIIRDVDVVFEIVGADTINESLRALSREGTLVLIGNVSGAEISLKRPALTIMREQKIIGSAAYTKKEVQEAVELVHRGIIEPIYAKYKLEDANQAFKDLIQGKIIGRAVLVP